MSYLCDTHRYACRKPYGEWLSHQVVTLDDIKRSVAPQALQPQFLNPAHADGAASNGNGNGSAPKTEPGLLTLLEPLKMFG